MHLSPTNCKYFNLHLVLPLHLCASEEVYIFIYIYIYIKFSRYRPGVAQRYSSTLP